MFLYYYIKSKICPNCFEDFLFSRNKKNSNLKILDVGCGNDQVIRIKKILSDCSYDGIDISKNLTQKSLSLTRKLVITSPKKFVDGIEKLKENYDLIVSKHNLEHCNEPYKTLDAICKKLNKKGSLYIAFPSQKSTKLPSRRGTLNYYDDKTHAKKPPDFIRVKEICEKNKLKITFYSVTYRPIIGFLIGFIFEPISILTNKVMPFTWYFYGFETILHAEKE